MKTLLPFDTLFFIVCLIALVWAIRADWQRRRKARAEHRALFEQRQRQQQRTGPPDVSLLVLTERQLAGWQELLLEMESTNASLEQIRYCRQQIERFEREVTWLKSQ